MATPTDLEMDNPADAPMAVAAALPRIAWHTPIALLGLSLAVAVPFINKPIHMDGPVTIVMANHILEYPLDPLGYCIHWDDKLHQGYELNNPPLTGYLMALGMLVGGMWEVTLHAVEAVMVFVAALAMFGLARRWCRHPWAVALLVLASPGFIPSQNIMFDVTLLALWLAAAWAWVEGVERDRAWLWRMGAILAGLAILTKYSALVLVPLLVAYALLRRRPRALSALVLTAAIVGGWAWHNNIYYGQPHMLGRPTPPVELERLVTRSLTVVKAAGSMCLLGLLCPFMLGAFSRRRRWLIVMPLLVVALGGTLATTALMLSDNGVFQHRLTEFHQRGMDTYIYTLLVMLLAMMGLGVLALGAAVMGSCRTDAQTGGVGTVVFLWLWLLGVLGFNVLFSPFVALRNLLPALVPLVVLGVRAWDATADPERPRRRVALAVVVVLTAILGYAVGEGDRQYAQAYKNQAYRLAEMLKPDAGRIWSVGYWGWGWYAKQAGFQALRNGRRDEVREGDKVVVAGGVHGDPTYLRVPMAGVTRHPMPLGGWPVLTVSRFYRVGFYGTHLDSVPYVFARFNALPIYVWTAGPQPGGGASP